MHIHIYIYISKYIYIYVCMYIYIYINVYIYLCRLLRIMDDDGDKKLSRNELKFGLKNYGVDLAATVYM
jgi:hypothetical protein